MHRRVPSACLQKTIRSRPHRWARERSWNTALVRPYLRRLFPIDAKYHHPDPRSEARARGVDVTIDQYPYTASATSLNSLFPRWALEGGRNAVFERLGAAEQRAKVKAGIVDAITNDRGGGDPKNVVITSCGFDATVAGKSLADLTRARGAEVTIENAAETA
ncbi:MAG: hypothetical protein K2X03_31525, partial [Bryobacteraceae bacterium]|nr:hypothetical protein [Bryobacteraceae bacterium]